MKHPLGLGLYFSVLAACASTPVAPAQTQTPTVVEPAAPQAAGIAEPPFTAEQIRAATPVGRSYEFKLEGPGQPPVLQRITFLEVTPELAVSESVNLDASGAPIGEPERGSATWVELAGHAAYSRDNTEVSDDQVEVPAGKFACRLYTVTEGSMRSRVYFAKELPGAPVLMVVEKDGQVIQTMTLMRHVPGGS